MQNYQNLLDKAVFLIQLHLRQLNDTALSQTKDGDLKGLTQYDSQVIERYTKLLITLNKKEPDDLEGLSEAELEAIANGQDNVPTENGDSE